MTDNTVPDKIKTTYTSHSLHWGGICTQFPGGGNGCHPFATRWGGGGNSHGNLLGEPGWILRSLTVRGAENRDIRIRGFSAYFCEMKYLFKSLPFLIQKGLLKRVDGPGGGYGGESYFELGPGEFWCGFVVHVGRDILHYMEMYKGCIDRNTGTVSFHPWNARRNAGSDKIPVNNTVGRPINTLEEDVHKSFGLTHHTGYGLNAEWGKTVSDIPGKVISGIEWMGSVPKRVLSVGYSTTATTKGATKFLPAKGGNTDKSMGVPYINGFSYILNNNLVRGMNNFYHFEMAHPINMLLDKSSELKKSCCMKDFDKSGNETLCEMVEYDTKAICNTFFDDYCSQNAHIGEIECSCYKAFKEHGDRGYCYSSNCNNFGYKNIHHQSIADNPDCSFALKCNKWSNLTDEEKVYMMEMGVSSACTPDQLKPPPTPEDKKQDIPGVKNGNGSNPPPINNHPPTALLLNNNNLPNVSTPPPPSEDNNAEYKQFSDYLDALGGVLGEKPVIEGISNGLLMLIFILLFVVIMVVILKPKKKSGKINVVPELTPEELE